MRFSCSTSKSRTVSPALVDDAEAQLLGAAAAQLGLLDDDAQVAGRDGEAADGLCGGGGVGRSHVIARFVGPGRGVVAVRLDRAARERRAAEEGEQQGREGGEAGGDAGGVGHEGAGEYTGRGYAESETLSDTPGGLATLLRMATTDPPNAATPRPRSSCSSASSAWKGRSAACEKMVDEDRYCIDVLTQISAIQAALDKVALGLMDDHARHCVIDGPADLKDERTEELMAAVARLMRRG